MRRSAILFAQNGSRPLQSLIEIRNATFYRHHPTAADKESPDANPKLFSDLHFALPSKPLIQDKERPGQQHWAVIGDSCTTTFLEVLRGTHTCVPPTARSFPYLSSDEIEAKDHRLRSPSNAIQYVGFNGGKGQGSGGGIRGAYLSARYESRREESDRSVLQYVKGGIDLNPSEGQHKHDKEDEKLFSQVVADLQLQKMLSMPVSNLSNGQTRRARIARALLGKPELLLLDEPFMGLDPPTLTTISSMLRDLAYKSSPRLILALRPQDPIPDWITHLVILGNNYTVPLMGPKENVLFALERWVNFTPIKTSNHHLGNVLAKRMNALYGPPLTGVGASLTQSGILNPLGYHEILRRRAQIFCNPIRDHFLKGRLERVWLTHEQRKTLPPEENKDYTTWTLDQLKTLAFSAPPASAELAHLEVSPTTPKESRPIATSTELSSLDAAETETVPPIQIRGRPPGEPLIDLNGIVVKYGSKVVLGHPPSPGLYLTIRRGTRLILLGPNGSGKTTLLSLLTSDHPQSYSLPIEFFGRSRLPTQGKPGLSLWDIQSRIGHSSPEIHAFFPRYLTVRRVLESSWAETFAGKPRLNFERDQLVSNTLRWWEPELRQHDIVATQDRKVRDTAYFDLKRRIIDKPFVKVIRQCYPPVPLAPTLLRKRFKANSTPKSDGFDDDILWAESSEITFGTLPFGTQRLLLLLRSIIKQPDIIVLDEAFSGLSATVREKAICWLECGEHMFIHHKTGQRVRNMRPAVEKLCAAKDIKYGLLVVHGFGQKRKAKPYMDVWSMSGKEIDKATEAAPPVGPQWTGLTSEQALVVVSHVREEVPGVVDEWVRLPGEEEVSEHGRGVEMGKCEPGSVRTVEGWSKIWGLQVPVEIAHPRNHPQSPVKGVGVKGRRLRRRGLPRLKLDVNAGSPRPLGRPRKHPIATTGGPRHRGSSHENA